MTRRSAAAGRLALCLLVAGAVVGWRLGPGDPLTDRIEGALVDLRFRLRGPLPSPPEVAVVALDEAAARAFPGPARRRRALAEAARRLRAAGASVVAVALVLEAETAADGSLAAALAGGRAALGVAGLSEAGAPPPPSLREALDRSAFRVVVAEAAAPAPLGVAAPAPRLAAAAALGHVNLRLSPDRVARSAPLALDLGAGAPLPSLALVAARLARGEPPEALRLRRGEAVELGPRRFETDAAGRVALNLHGPRGSIETTPLGALLEGAAPAEAFAGRVVFIGGTGETVGPLFATPYDARTPGVEALATLTANLLRDELLRTGGAAGALSAGLGLLGALGVAGASLLRSTALAAALGGAALAGVAAALQLAFEAERLQADAAAAFGGALAAGALAWALRTRGADRERDRATRYLSPLASRALAEGERERMGEVAAAFLDLEGSTALAEGLDPQETLALYRAVQERFVALCAAHGGALAERQGDGALILFGPEGGRRDKARAALRLGRAALEPVPFGETALRFRASAAFGRAVVAEFGGHVSVAGDVVNVAARLQDVARAEGVGFVVDGALLRAAEEAEAPVRLLRREALRGRAGPVEAWRAG